MGPVSTQLACRRGASGLIDRTSALDRSSRKSGLLSTSHFRPPSLQSSSLSLLLSCNILTPLRIEKLEDARARAAIKAQIEADKQKRADKAARDKAIREGQPVPDSSSSTPQVGTGAAKAASAVGSGMKGKDFPETRLQVRLSTGGAPLVKSFKSDAREYRRAPCCGFVVPGFEVSSGAR